VFFFSICVFFRVVFLQQHESWMDGNDDLNFQYFFVPICKLFFFFQLNFTYSIQLWILIWIHLNLNLNWIWIELNFQIFKFKFNSSCMQLSFNNFIQMELNFDKINFSFYHFIITTSVEPRFVCHMFWPKVIVGTNEKAYYLLWDLFFIVSWIPFSL
jgi:hypothetical protein